MQDLPAFGLANTITGFATFFAGCTCLVLSRLVQPQPARWRFAYWMIVVTGVFTVTLHGFGETVSGFGPRWFWAFLDTGSNIVVAWAVALAVLGDFWPPAAQRRAGALLTAAMLAGVGWHFLDTLPGGERSHLLPLGAWGGFYPGESFLIAFSWLVIGLFVARRREIAPRAKPLLWLCAAIFFCGMLLATASNDRIVAPFFAMHALWHLVGAFGFVVLWAFNSVRFAGYESVAKASSATNSVTHRGTAA